MDITNKRKTSSYSTNSIWTWHNSRKESQSLKVVEEVQAKIKTLENDKSAKELELKQSQKEIGTIDKQTHDAMS